MVHEIGGLLKRCGATIPEIGIIVAHFPLAGFVVSP